MPDSYISYLIVEPLFLPQSKYQSFQHADRAAIASAPNLPSFRHQWQSLQYGHWALLSWIVGPSRMLPRSRLTIGAEPETANSAIDITKAMNQSFFQKAGLFITGCLSFFFAF